MKEVAILILLLILAYLLMQPDAAYRLNHRLSGSPIYSTASPVKLAPYRSPLDDPPRPVKSRH